MTTANITITGNTCISKLVELCGADPLSVGLDRGVWNLAVAGITQEELDASWAIYNSDLEQYELKPVRDAKKESISIEAHKYIGESYPSFRRELFIALAEEARNAGLTNRVVYINQLLIWVKTIVAAVLAAEDMIDAAMTIEEINSINLNTEVFLATDPEITVRGAMAIED